MKRLLLALVVLFVAHAAFAQTVHDPSTFTFQASSNHATAVDHYSLNVIIFNGAFVFSRSIGKPTPDANGTITGPLPFNVKTDLAGNVSYVATVTAYGTATEDPAFKADSGVSNPFDHPVQVAPTAPGNPVVR